MSMEDKGTTTESTLGARNAILHFPVGESIHVDVIESDGTAQPLNLEGLPGTVADLVALGADITEDEVENGVPFLEIVVDSGVTGTLDGEEITGSEIAEFVGRAIVQAIRDVLDRIESVKNSAQTA